MPRRPHALVAENGARFHARHSAADHVEIGAADGTVRDADNGVRGLLDLGFRHVLQTNIPNIVKDHSLHSVSLLCLDAYKPWLRDECDFQSRKRLRSSIRVKKPLDSISRSKPMAACGR
jgi:hypothetical protein